MSQNLAVESGDYFVMSTNAVSRNKAMDCYTYRLYNVLLSYAGEKGHCWPSQVTLANDCNMSERQVRYSLALLRDVWHLVNWQRKGKTNCYTVVKLPTLSAKRVDNSQSGTINQVVGGNPAQTTYKSYSSPNNKHKDKGYKPYNNYVKQSRGNASHKPIDFSKFEVGGKFAHLVR